MAEIILNSGGYDSAVLTAYCKNLWKDENVEYYLYHCCIFDNENFENSVMVNNAETKIFLENNKNEPIILSKLYALKENDYDDFGGLKKRSSYVPARNSLLVLDAVNKFYSTHKKEDELIILIGLIKTEPRFPDGNSKWLYELNNLLNSEFNGKVLVLAPFIDYDKDKVFEMGSKLGVDLTKTFSCNYDDNGKECGQCGNCIWRKKHSRGVNCMADKSNSNSKKRKDGETLDIVKNYAGVRIRGSLAWPKRGGRNVAIGRYR